MKDETPPPAIAAFGLGILVLVWLASAGACTQGVEPRREGPQAPTAPLVTEPPLAAPTSGDLGRAVPDLADILFEERWSSTRGLSEATASAGATFPLFSIYADGTVLHMIPDDPGFALGHARLDPAQLDELRARIDALAPLDRLQGTDLICRRDTFVSSVIHGVMTFTVRAGDEQLCFLGCPKQPEALGAAFLELFDLVQSFVDLDYDPWVPDHGHVAAIRLSGTPTPPWSDDPLEPDRPRAWLLPDELGFALAWDTAGGRVGPISIDLDGGDFSMSVVPWRPGEDRSEEVALYNDFFEKPSPCPLGARILSGQPVR